MCPNSTTQRCPRCKRELPLAAYSPSRQGKPGQPCRECNQRTIRERYPQHQKQVRRYQNEYKATHIEAMRASRIRRYQANRADIIKKTREWQRARPEWRAAVDRRYSARNQPKLRANADIYRRANMIRYRESAARRRARERAAQTEKIDYRAIWERDQGICHICGAAVDPTDLHYDHITPISKGGAHSMENIAVSHAWCNLRKGAKVTK